MVPQRGPYREKCSVSRANGLIIYVYLSEAPLKSPSTKHGENIWSQSTEPHSCGRGSYTTLLLLPQCHAAFSTIPSTLVWVDQNTDSLRESW